MNGAKRVYAFEPFPHAYRFASKNVELNGLGNKISIMNVGLGGKRTHMIINKKFKSTPSSRLTNAKKGMRVDVVTLKDIVDLYKVNHAFLKMDCEGCEYNTLLSTPNETLRKFDGVLIQYHYGYVNVKKKLIGAGFDVSNSIPMHYDGFGTSKGSEGYSGFLYGKLKA